MVVAGDGPREFNSKPTRRGEGSGRSEWTPGIARADGRALGIWLYVSQSREHPPDLAAVRSGSSKPQGS